MLLRFLRRENQPNRFPCIMSFSSLLAVSHQTEKKKKKKQTRTAQLPPPSAGGPKRKVPASSNHLLFQGFWSLLEGITSAYGMVRFSYFLTLQLALNTSFSLAPLPCPHALSHALSTLGGFMKVLMTASMWEPPHISWKFGWCRSYHPNWGTVGRRWLLRQENTSSGMCPLAGCLCSGGWLHACAHIDSTNWI